VIDEIELDSGKRREGVVFSVGAFISKTTIGIGAFIAGIVIEVVGIQSTSIPGQVGAGVLQSLGWFTLLIVVGFAVIGFFFTTQLRLSRNDHNRLRAALARRH
jgi:Na+/melibiose symporter-like transporter